MSHQLAAFVRSVCWPIAALFLLVACGVREVVTPVTQVATTQPTATDRPLASATPPRTTTAAPPPTAAPEPRPLVGPLALLIIEEPQSLAMRAVIYDFGANSARDLPLPESRPSAARWLGDGCELYIGGTVYNLQGAAVWQAPPAVREAQGGLYVEQLSPGKQWLAAPVFSGAQTYDSTEFVDVETVSLTPPFATFRLTQRGGAAVEGIVWSPDEQWVYFSDYDAGGLLQVFRASPDGQSSEQLTGHAGTLGRVTRMALSPDGSRLAYSVVNLATQLPAEVVASDEGWIGVVDVEARTAAQFRIPHLLDAQALWWNAAGDELLVLGQSLPNGPSLGQSKQLHWIRVAEATTPIRSLDQADARGAIGWVMPLAADMRTLFVQSGGGAYLLQDAAFSPHPAKRLFEAIESSGRIIDFIPGPASFPGEAACWQ